MRRPEDHLLISQKQIYPAGSNNVLRLACNSWIEPIETCKFSKVNTSMETSSEAKPSDSTTLVPEGNRSVSTESLTNEDNNWDIVGEDLLLAITEEDVSRLVDIFPGACKFEYGNGENSVFYGSCKRCSDRLKPSMCLLLLLIYYSIIDILYQYYNSFCLLKIIKLTIIYNENNQNIIISCYLIL
ncbi:unnamed protein product [Schistosoma margrebowiei]|uniref:Uncharacterized protein n=1 Tax=Schistosoma margrebowiei TaxID=48269 RepID=A0A183NA36_9TREM|nr:unnamed protein product [Schistosoma margrebowiei]